jgi:LEA14-like dessication related protein
MRILAIILLFVLSSCAILETAVEKPRVNLREVNVQDPSATEATLVFNFLVDNPNSIPLKVDQVDYTVKLNGKDFTKGVMDKGVSIGANSSALVPLPIRIKYTDVFNSVSELISKGTTPYQVEGAVKLGLLSIPFKDAGEVKLSELK